MSAFGKSRSVAVGIAAAMFGATGLGGVATHAYAADATAPRITSVSPTVISPNHDGIYDSTAFRVHLPTSEVVSFLIRDAEGRTIQGPHTPGLRAAGDYSWGWNGKNNKARISFDGTYTMVVTATPVSDMTTHPAATATVRLDTTPPGLTDVTGGGSTIYPFCSRCGNTTFRPKVTVNESGRLWLIIPYYRLHESLVTAQPHASIGTFQLTWNGRDQQGRVVAQGAYKYYFTALDSVFNRRTTPSYVVHVSYKRSP